MDDVFNNLSNFLSSYDENNPNQYLCNYILKISDMIKEGLKYDTKFQDILSTGFLNSYSEYPLTYLTYVNLRTRAVTREDPSWGFKDFDCDETWNISTSNYGLWTPNKYYTWYYTNSEKYLCNNCTNHYSSKNANNPPLLNYLEFTLEQAIERYSYLKDTENNDEYNGLVYYFTAAEFLRNSSFIEHLQKMIDFNLELTEIQNNIFILFKESVDLSKEIINEYINIYNSFKEGDIYSSIYCEFLREDLNFVLGEIKNGIINKINKLKLFHILINFINIVLSNFMIIFYCIISYNLPYFPITNPQLQKIKGINKKLKKHKKGIRSLFSYIRKTRSKKIKSKSTKKNIKDKNNRRVIIKISGNIINNNSYQEGGNKNESNNDKVNSQINNIQLLNNFLTNELIKKNCNIQNEGLGDAEDPDFPSQASIIGEFKNKYDVLKLNKNKK